MLKPVFLLCLAPLLLCSCGNEPKPVAAAPHVTDTAATAAAADTIKNKDTLQAFSWAEGACTYDGVFDSRSYSAAQIRGTYSVCFESAYLNTDATVFKPEDIAQLNLDALNNEYAAVKNKLAGLELVPGTYWQNLKKLRERELEECYAIKKLTIQAYANPRLLLDNPYTAYCPDYAKALASGDETLLLAAWKKLLEEQKSKNGFPQDLQKKFDEQSASPDRLLYAKYELMTYGWWNRVNHQVTHVEISPAMTAAFEKLFVSVKEECDGP